jgi:hypothetical protein
MISGYVCVRDGVNLDFCFIEAIHSLLPVCNEVVAADFGSQDDTLDALYLLKAKAPKLRIVTRPRTDIVRDIGWWVDTLNWARSYLRYPFQLTLDADEVLDERAYPLILEAANNDKALWFRRNNYWNDPCHIAPVGTVCGDAVVRFGPTDLPMVSDEPHPEGVPAIQQLAGPRDHIPEELTIHHYGFIRKQDALIAKCAINLRAFFGAEPDVRLTEAQSTGKRWQDCCPFTKPLQTYSGPHPEIAHAWLKEHGYEIHT